MKKHLLWLPVLLLIMAAALHTQVAAVIDPAKPVNRNISFAIYKGSNYNSDVYRNTSAQVKITVEKVNGKKRTLVWEKTLEAKQVSQYPSFREAQTQTITVPNVLDKKEHIEVTYTLTYNSKGSTLQMQGGSVIDGKDKEGQLRISI